MPLSCVKVRRGGWQVSRGDGLHQEPHHPLRHHSLHLRGGARGVPQQDTGSNPASFLFSLTLN